MKLNAAQAGFLKGLGTVIAFSVVGFLANSANLEGVVSPALASLGAALFASIESWMKAKTDGEKGLFGAVAIQK